MPSRHFSQLACALFGGLALASCSPDRAPVAAGYPAAYGSPTNSGGYAGPGFGPRYRNDAERFGLAGVETDPASARREATEMARNAAAERRRLRAERGAAAEAEWRRIDELNRSVRDQEKAARRAARHGITDGSYAAAMGHEVPAVAVAPRPKGVLNRIFIGGRPLGGDLPPAPGASGGVPPGPADDRPIIDDTLGGFVGGLFGGGGRPKRSAKAQHRVFVDHAQLAMLSPGSARIEISLGEQRARVYRGEGMQKTLVIDVPVSTGKSGFETPTGQFKIGEKLERKRSTLYGAWFGADGQPVPSRGESASPPPGGVRFEGAEMPYWMRLVDGIGMHVGEVPGYPASHGCIRVPASVQPLIFSKVGLGTPVEIRR